MYYLNFFLGGGFFDRCFVESYSALYITCMVHTALLLLSTIFSYPAIVTVKNVFNCIY